MAKNFAACLTIVRNEAFWLPRWVAWYQDQMPGSLLYVIDHETDDGSIDTSREVGGPLNKFDMTGSVRYGPTRPYGRIPVSRPHTDDVGWMLRTVEEIFEALCEEFRWVVFAEVDEFLVANPEKYHNLHNYLFTRAGSQSFTATGYDVCQRAGDAPLDPAKPILGQRGWKRNDRWDKTLISPSPMRWEVGFHRPRADVYRPEPDPDLLLIHTHYCDVETQWARLESRRKGREAFPNDWGRQNKLPSREAFLEDFATATAGAEDVPEQFRELL